MFSRLLHLLLFAAFLACCLPPVHGHEVSVHVHVYQHNTARLELNGLESFLSATSPGDSTPIYGVQTKPSTVSFKLKLGLSYRFHLRQPSFYHFSSEEVRIVPDLPGATMSLEMPIVPVYEGITMVNLERSSFKTGAFSNITFPDGVFNFNFSSRFANFRPHTNLGAGNPPAKFANSEMVRFSALPSGLYSFYVEARPTRASLGSIATFKDARGLYALFAGDNPVTGHKATFASQSRAERNWHIGDLVVAAINQSCFAYQWADVDSYGSEYGAFDRVVYPVSRPVLLRECLNVVIDNSTVPTYTSSPHSNTTRFNVVDNSTVPTYTGTPGSNSTRLNVVDNSTVPTYTGTPGSNSTRLNVVNNSTVPTYTGTPGSNSTRLNVVDNSTVPTYSGTPGSNSTHFKAVDNSTVPTYTGTPGSNSTRLNVVDNTTVSTYTGTPGSNSTHFKAVDNSTVPTYTGSPGSNSTRLNAVDNSTVPIYTGTPGSNSTSALGFNSTGFNFTCLFSFDSECTPGSVLSWILYQWYSLIEYLF